MGVAVDEATAAEAGVLQLGRFGSMAWTNCAGTWAARRVVETTKMEVSCILDGAL